MVKDKIMLQQRLKDRPLDLKSLYKWKDHHTNLKIEILQHKVSIPTHPHHRSEKKKNCGRSCLRPLKMFSLFVGSRSEALLA